MGQQATHESYKLSALPAPFERDRYLIIHTCHLHPDQLPFSATILHRVKSASAPIQSPSVSTDAAKAGVIMHSAILVMLLIVIILYYPPPPNTGLFLKTIYVDSLWRCNTHVDFYLLPMYQLSSVKVNAGAHFLADQVRSY